jgi:hypothetical protein
MKKTLFAVLTFISSHVFSQSYLILNNGVTLTTDKAGFVYDFGHFFLPYKVTNNGGNFFFENRKLITIDSSGFLYEKSLRVDNLQAKGINYFVTEDYKLVTIDSQGFFYEFESKDKIFKKIIANGGSYFLVKSEVNKNDVDLYVINHKGNYLKVNVAGLDCTQIDEFGGNYFQTENNLIYSVSNEGFVYRKSEFNPGSILQKGGNFFIDSNKILYTISDNGMLNIPSLPLSFDISAVKKIGSNYLIDVTGRLFVVSGNGEVNERDTSHDFNNVKIISM